MYYVPQEEMVNERHQDLLRDAENARLVKQLPGKPSRLSLALAAARHALHELRHANERVEDTRQTATFRKIEVR